VVLLYNLIISTWKFVKPKIEIDLKFWKELLKEAWPFALTGTFINVYLWIDSVMLSYMEGNEVVGWYSAAYRLVLILLFIPMVFDSAIFPVMARAYVSKKDILKIILEEYFKFMLIISTLIGIIVTISSDNIILLIYGDKYLGSIPALQILIWALVLIFLRVPFERLFEASNKQILVTKAFGYSVILNIILNYILIPKYSYMGAGIATVLTDLMVLLIIIYMFLSIGFENVIFTKKNIGIFIGVIVIGVIAGFIVEYLSLNDVFATIIFFNIIYFGLLYLTKIITKNDIQKIIKKSK
jgi:O-antigen/teichoic acid export membrane protein